MKALFFILCFLSSLIRLNAQCPEELVINGGFEDYLECPLDITANYTDLQDYSGTWSNASFNTADFYHSCSISQEPFIGGANPLNNIYGGQIPASGHGMGGFAITCGDNFTEYLKTKLKVGLTIDKSYSIQFSLSSGDSRGLIETGVICRSSSIELLLSTEDLFWPSTTTMPGIIPQISTGPEILIDSVSWYNYSISFDADSNYQYLIIGKWTSNILNEDCFCFQDPKIAGTSYYFVDDVSVKEDVPIEFPNVFTPNGDAKNRVFQVRGYCGDLIIYNRWGQLIAEVSNDQGWNGRVNGEDAPEGTYFCITDDQKHKGAFQLLR